MTAPVKKHVTQFPAFGTISIKTSSDFYNGNFKLQPTEATNKFITKKGHPFEQPLYIMLCNKSIVFRL